MTNLKIKPINIFASDFDTCKYYNGPTLDFRSDSEDMHTIGTWWWNSDVLIKPDSEIGADVNELLQMLIANGVNEVYFSLNFNSVTSGDEEPVEGKLSEGHLASFIEKCSDYGIKVSALTGEGGLSALGWFDASNEYAQIVKFINSVAAYNEKVDENQKFYGVHLDLEPDMHSNRPLYLKWFEQFLINARRLCDDVNLKLEMDINAWFNKNDVVIDNDGNEINILDVLMTKCHSIGIMSYRTDAKTQYKISEFEYSYAMKHNCQVLLGSETMLPEDLGDESDITYYNKGSAEFIKEMQSIKAMLNESGYNNSGIAVHWVDAWYRMFKRTK